MADGAAARKAYYRAMLPEYGSTASSLRESNSPPSAMIINASPAVHWECDTGKFLSNFTPKKRIGIGAFGEVFEAENKFDKHSYAVKIIPMKDREADARKKKLREVQALAELKHTGIVRYFTAWPEKLHVTGQSIVPWLRFNDVVLPPIDDEDPEIDDINKTNSILFLFIQLQLCEEKTLSDFLGSHKAPEYRVLSTMKDWLRQLCDAICYIHKKGLIHRDIKPSNILFDEDKYLKIGDFGLVKSIADVDSTVGGITGNPSQVHTEGVGTRRYMSPEQIHKLRITSKSDIFALGLIFCEMIIPFQYQERIDTLEALQDGQRPVIVENCADKEKKIIYWMTKVKPDDRASGIELFEGSYLSGYPNLAHKNFAEKRDLHRSAEFCIKKNGLNLIGIDSININRMAKKSSCYIPVLLGKNDEPDLYYVQSQNLWQIPSGIQAVVEYLSHYQHEHRTSTDLKTVNAVLRMTEEERAVFAATNMVSFQEVSNTEIAMAAWTQEDLTSAFNELIKIKIIEKHSSPKFCIMSRGKELEKSEDIQKMAMNNGCRIAVQLGKKPDPPVDYYCVKSQQADRIASTILVVLNSLSVSQKETISLTDPAIVNVVAEMTQDERTIFAATNMIFFEEVNETEIVLRAWKEEHLTIAHNKLNEMAVTRNM